MEGYVTRDWENEHVKMALEASIYLTLISHPIEYVGPHDHTANPNQSLLLLFQNCTYFAEFGGCGGCTQTAGEVFEDVSGWEIPAAF